MVEAEVWRIAKAVGGVVVGGDPHAVVRGAAVDSRKVKGGEVFFALKGERTDGHLFVNDAFARGAVCAVVERLDDGPGTKVLVKSTLEALGRLARWWGERIGVTVVAVTGSVGKTTTKELIAAALGVWLSTAKSPGTYNTEIGLPLAILSAPPGTQVLVAEMAMRGPGQIRELCEIARPKVGVVTRVGTSHLEFFRSREEIALAKAELVESLPDDGVAILRADDWAFDILSRRARGRVVTFGGRPGADFWARRLRSFGADGVGVEAVTPAGGVRFELRVPGRHNGINALAALAVAYTFGVPLKRAAEALEGVEPLPGRLSVRRVGGVVVLDDTYNASPESVEAAIEVLCDTDAERRAVCLGEMRELGPEGERLHREVGGLVARSGLDLLVTVGEAGGWIADGAVEAGMSQRRVRRLSTPEEAGRFLASWAKEGDAVLFKASRAVEMERAVEVFEAAL